MISWMLAIIILITLTIWWQRTRINRLYYAITLFNPKNIVENFSNMQRVFNTTALPTHDATDFSYKKQVLTQHYEYKQTKNLSVAEFLIRTNTTALLVYKDDALVSEQYYLGTKATDRRISWSMAKSYLSGLFGIALGEGHINSIDQLVTDYVPSLSDSGYAGVSIKQVLQMSSGVKFNEDYAEFGSDINRFGRSIALGGSFDDFAASLVNERVAGTYMHYVSIDTHVLGMVLRAATGKTYLEYFDEKLWSKLGSESNAYYLTDDSGEPMVLGGLNMMSRDYLRLGVTYLNNGVINGEQIIPAQWIKDSIPPDASHLMPGERDNSDHIFGYGYQWWVPENSDKEFFAWGIYGQFIYVNQKHNVVIVKNSANTKFMDNDLNDPIETIELFRAISKNLA